VAATILQRRDRLHIYYEGEDLTPRFLVNSMYGSLEDRRTAFDMISLANAMNSQSISGTQMRISNITPLLSFSSCCTLDEIVCVRQNESFVSWTKESIKGSSKAFDVVEDTEDVPPLFHLPKQVDIYFVYWLQVSIIKSRDRNINHAGA
jgi:hypothetical protein